MPSWNASPAEVLLGFVRRSFPPCIKRRFQLPCPPAALLTRVALRCVGPRSSGSRDWSWASRSLTKIEVEQRALEVALHMWWQCIFYYQAVICLHVRSSL